MPVGVVPHCRPCLLAWYLSKGHACWFVATAKYILLVESRWKNDGYKSGATCTEVLLHKICLLIRCHSEIFQLYLATISYMHAGSFIQTHVFVKCFSIRQGICSITNPSDTPTGKIHSHILVLQSSWWGRESWLLCLICLPGVSWWLSGSSSRCHWVVCGLWLWYFLIILTYYL